MQDPHLFEYAIIRVVPRVEREEFINVGVILVCPKQKFLKGKVWVNIKKIESFGSDLDMEELEEHLNAFVSICDGNAVGSPISSLDLASRFRWLTATRSTVIQCSKVHPGFCTDAVEKLDHIFDQMVL